MDKLLKKKNRTKYERMLLMAICSLVMTKKFKRMTSEQIFDWLDSRSERIF